MADNFVTNAGAGGNTYASDDITAVHYPILKIAYGALDSATLVSTSNGFPVQQQGTWNIGTVTTVTTVSTLSTITNVVHVDDNAGSLTVDNGGTFAVQESGSHVQADDAAFTPATSKVLMAGFTFDDVAPDSVNEGDGGAARMSANRNIYTTLRDAAGNERGANVNASNQLSVSVDNTVTVGSHAVTNAGTFAVQVDGAALTSLQLIDDVVYAEDVASANADKGVAILAVQKATPANTAGTDGDYEMLQISAGRLWTSTTVTGTVTVGSHDVTNAGTFAVQANPGTAANWGVYVEDAAETAGGNLSMIGAVRRDTLASSSGTSGDNSTVNTNNVGALWVAGTSSTNGGWSVATGSIAATKTDIGTANTAGNVAGWYIYNPNASVAYVQFFNTQASGVTLGTTAPVYSLGIPATSAANVAPGSVGISHSTAISIAVTTTRAGSTGPGSTVDYNIWYKQ